jgi:hypothetical protein
MTRVEQNPQGAVEWIKTFIDRWFGHSVGLGAEMQPDGSIRLSLSNPSPNRKQRKVVAKVQRDLNREFKRVWLSELGESP